MTSKPSSPDDCKRCKEGFATLRGIMNHFKNKHHIIFTNPEVLLQ